MTDPCETCGEPLPEEWQSGQWTPAGYMHWMFERRDCEHCGETYFRTLKHKTEEAT